MKPKHLISNGVYNEGGARAYVQLRYTGKLIQYGCELRPKLVTALTIFMQTSQVLSKTI